MYKLSTINLRMYLVVLCVVTVSLLISCGGDVTNSPGEESCTGTITTKDGLRTAVDALIAASGNNADFNSIDTSCVTDMSELFYVEDSTRANIYSNFNGDISGWDTRNVTNMNKMLADTLAFNQDIGGWNTSNVTDMSYMFIRAYTFNQNIGRWDTSKVTDMTSMFANARAFNQDIGNWNTSKVTDMTQMFILAQNFNQDLTQWSNASMPRDANGDTINTGNMFTSSAITQANKASWMP